MKEFPWKYFVGNLKYAVLRGMFPVKDVGVKPLEEVVSIHVDQFLIIAALLSSRDTNFIAIKTSLVFHQ